jgi:rRNA maturation protein Nop10
MSDDKCPNCGASNDNSGSSDSTNKCPVCGRQYDLAEMPEVNPDV